MTTAPRLVFAVDGVPVPQPRPRAYAKRVGGKDTIRTFTPPSAAEWKRLVSMHARLAVRDVGAARWPTDSEYVLRIRVRRASRRGDVDNYAKGVMDALNGIAWDDDRQVRELHVVVEDVAKGAASGVDVVVEAGR